MGKKRRRFIGIVVRVMVVVLLVTNWGFANNENRIYKRTVSINGKSVVFTDEIKEGSLRICTYTRNDESQGITNYSELDELLIALGFDREQLSTISSSSYERFASASVIRVITRYERVNDITGETFPVDRETAITESEAINAQKISNIVDKHGKKETDTKGSGTNQDAYRKVTFSYTQLSGGQFHFLTSIQWLVMPSVRDVDSVGSCAMNCTVDPNNRTGSYQYQYTTYNLNTNQTTNSTSGIYTIGNAYKKNKSEGSWYGSAGIFNLPSDITTDDYIICYTKYIASYSYDGHVNLPTLETYFNAIGTHSHAIVSSLFSDVAINIGGMTFASITLSGFLTYKQDLNVEFEIHYIP